MNEYYTQTQVRDILEFEHGLNITRVTMINYCNNGYIKQSGTIKHGQRVLPVYTRKEIDEFVASIPQLRKEGKIRIWTKNSPLASN